MENDSQQKHTCSFTGTQKEGGSSCKRCTDLQRHLIWVPRTSESQGPAYAEGQERARRLRTGKSDEKDACEAWRERAKRHDEATDKEIGRERAET